MCSGVFMEGCYIITDVFVKCREVNISGCLDLTTEMGHTSLFLNRTTFCSLPRSQAGNRACACLINRNVLMVIDFLYSPLADQQDTREM